MGLIIIMTIPYVIVLISQTLFKKKSIRNGKKTDNMGELIVTVFGNGILVHVCSSPSFTANMRAMIITLFTGLYIIFWMANLSIGNKEEGNRAMNP